jgi:hypothetical protein
MTGVKKYGHKGHTAGDEAGVATPVATGDDEDDSGFEQGGVVQGLFQILILGSAPIYFR